MLVYSTIKANVKIWYKIVWRYRYPQRAQFPHGGMPVNHGLIID
jgi:hypothetical protein